MPRSLARARPSSGPSARFTADLVPSIADLDAHDNEGAQPGFVIEFFVAGAETRTATSASRTSRRRCALHHLRYDLPLVGTEVAAMNQLAEEGHLEGLVLETDPPATRFTVGFGFEGTEPRTTAR